MRELFRKEAIENHYFDSETAIAVKAIPIRWVFSLIVVVICAAAFAVWLFFGTVYETVTLRGIVWSDKGDDDVFAETSGVVSKTTVSVGDRVEAGDILAFIPDNEMLRSMGDDIEAVYDRYDKKSVIRAKTNGIITYIIDRNSYVNPGDMIASVVRYDANGNNDVVTAYVPDGQNELIDVGMEAQIMPDHAPRETYGYIMGYVSAVSDYPVTGEQIYNTDRRMYISEMDKDETYIEIKITMMRSRAEGDNLKWSKTSGNDMTVHLGDRCSADVILEVYRPYQWLLRWKQ